MSNTGTAQIPQAVNAYYDRQMLALAIPYFVHTMWGQVKDIPSGNGDTVKFRRYGLLTAATTALTEGVTPTGSALSITDITAQVSQYGDFVTLTDKLLFTTFDPVLTETAELLGEQAGDTIDQITRDVLVAGTNVYYASTAVSRITVAAGMVIDGTIIKKAVRFLTGQNGKAISRMVEPSTGYNTRAVNRAFMAICHTNTTYDLKNINGFNEVQFYSNAQDVMENEVGSFDRVRFVETTNAKVLTGTGAAGIDVYATLIFAMNAYATTRISGEALRNIVKPLGSAGTADPLDQRATSGWKATYVAKRLNEAWMIRIEHAVSA